MPASQARRAAAGRIASLARFRPVDHPERVSAARDYERAITDEHIAAIVDRAPVLTAEQRAKLSRLLAPAAATSVAATSVETAGAALAAALADAGIEPADAVPPVSGEASAAVVHALTQDPAQLRDALRAVASELLPEIVAELRAGGDAA